MQEQHHSELIEATTAWYPSGNTFAAGSEDRTFRVCDIRKNARVFAGRCCAKGGCPLSRCSPCGRFLAAADINDFIRAFDVTVGT